MARDYDDIPGTYVFDGRRSRQGYRLNMFCMSLNDAANRARFAADESAYIDDFGVTVEQKQAVIDRDYLRLLHLGGNMYYTFKIAIHDKKSMQFVGGQMSGISEDEFRQMMLDGGRPIDGNRRVGER
ncbi:MAG: protocatechuate 4,5-dioxygenase subunit alpha [Proteobacteria bacterium]|nr:protocatechuate 4,5-dioxygenase subunit alpha [Pseudomonadota bacterium]